MEDAIDEDADKRQAQLDDSCRGNKLPALSILPYDHKTSAARRRRIEIRRLKALSSSDQPDSKRLRSAMSFAASTTTTCDVTTEWTGATAELSCLRNLDFEARSISSLPADDDEASPASRGLSFVQPEMIMPSRAGNTDEAGSASIHSNEVRASSATNWNCCEEVRASPSKRCQETTGTENLTNAADSGKPGRKEVRSPYSEEYPSLNGLSDDSIARACDSSESWESEDAPDRGVLSGVCRNKQEPVLMRAGYLQEEAVEQRSREGFGPDREGSWTVESSTMSCVDNPTFTVDLPSSSFLSSVAVVPTDPQTGELPTGVKTIRGRRKEMEDAFTVVHRFLSLPCGLIGCCTDVCGAEPSRSSRDYCYDNVHFFGVYDGHGGAQVARHCRERLHSALAEEVLVRINADGFASAGTSSSRNGGRYRVDCWKEFWVRAMSDCFLRIDQEVGGVYRRSDISGLDDERITESSNAGQGEAIAPETVGSTAVVAVVSARQIIVANCGDSRAVLSRGGQAIALSIDHKPERGDEMVRIEAAGGKVILWNGYRVFGMLAMSRAIGDRFLKPFVIADPEVTCTKRCEEDECLILASDGLWDVLSNDKVCEIARRFVAGGRGAQAAAARLTSAAHEKGSGDNITVVVVDLRRSRPSCSGHSKSSDIF